MSQNLGKISLTPEFFWLVRLWHPYSTKGKSENFVSLSKANVGKTVVLISWQVSCVMTSPAEIARLGLPNANDRISDAYIKSTL